MRATSVENLSSPQIHPWIVLHPLYDPVQYLPDVIYLTTLIFIFLA
jgi:hypothetical protein